MLIAVTGASGLIGSALVPALRAEGHQVLRLVRGQASAPDERRWDPIAGRLDPADLEGVAAVVHLAGAGVGDHRWTPTYRRTLIDSRVQGTGTVARALADVGGPSVLISSSAIGFYGDTGDTVVDESSPSRPGFLAELCRDWEAATAPAATQGVRVALVRTGIVLSWSGGALGRQLPIFRAGLGAPLGSGRQWVSWVSLVDTVAAIQHCLTSPVQGPVNVVSPAPVTNREFTKAMGRVLHRPTLPVAVPGWVLRAALGGFAVEGVLAGQRVTPAALLATGFAFEHRTIDSALRAALSRPAA